MLYIFSLDRESTYNVYIPVFSAICDYNIPCNPLILRRQLNRSKKSFTLDIRILFHLFLMSQNLLVLIISTKGTSTRINTDRKYLTIIAQIAKFAESRFFKCLLHYANKIATELLQNEMYIILLTDC